MGSHRTFREGMKLFEHNSSHLSPLPTSESYFSASVNLTTSTQQVIFRSICTYKFIFACDIDFENRDYQLEGKLGGVYENVCSYEREGRNIVIQNKKTQKHTKKETLPACL